MPAPSRGRTGLADLLDSVPMAKIEFIARGLARLGDRVLLCRNRKHGYVYLPGGHVEFGEGAQRALEREFEEETGLDVKAGGLLFVSEGRFEQKGKPRHELNLVFHVEHPHWPDPAPSLEDDIDFVWAGPSELRELDLRPASIRSWLLDGAVSDLIDGALPFVSD